MLRFAMVLDIVPQFMTLFSCYSCRCDLYRVLPTQTLCASRIHALDNVDIFGSFFLCRNGEDSCDLMRA